MKVYIVIELQKYKQPRILDVYKNKSDAMESISKSDHWCNIIEREVK